MRSPPARLNQQEDRKVFYVPKAVCQGIHLKVHSVLWTLLRGTTHIPTCELVRKALYPVC